MDDVVIAIKKGLFEAINAENQGFHFYSMAVNSTEDAKGKEMFAKLANDELEHLRYLRKQLKAFDKSGRPEPGLMLGKLKRYSDSSPIFSPEIKARIGNAHVEMTVLSIGIQLEKNAIEFYRKNSEKTENPFVKQFYAELADWEAEHYRILNLQFDELKEDYWHKADFAPF